MENLTLKDMCKDGCKKFGTRDYYKNAKIYNKNGVLLFESDIGMIAPGDILYIACEGKYICDINYLNFVNRGVI